MAESFPDSSKKINHLKSWCNFASLIAPLGQAVLIILGTSFTKSMQHQSCQQINNKEPHSKMPGILQWNVHVHVFNIKMTASKVDLYQFAVHNYTILNEKKKNFLESDYVALVT